MVQEHCTDFTWVSFYFIFSLLFSSLSSPDSGCPACSHRPGAVCSLSVPGEGGAARGPSPPLGGVSSLLGCCGECCHKVSRLLQHLAASDPQ